MTPINILTSTAAPLPHPNIDTDQIIPKQFLKRIERTGYEDFLFYDWRRIQEGPDAGKPNPAFVLNKPEHKGAEILLAERNFGCGSSREHAAWAINQYGFRARHRTLLRRHLLLQRWQERHHPRPPHRSRSRNSHAALHRQPQSQTHHLARSPNRHRRRRLPRPLRHRPLPQALPPQRLRRHRPDPPLRRPTQRLRIQTPTRILALPKIQGLRLTSANVISTEAEKPLY